MSLHDIIPMTSYVFGRLRHRKHIFGRVRHKQSCTKIRAGCNVNATNQWSVPPRRAMDYAAGSKLHESLGLIGGAGGKGLCRKGEKGGYETR